MFLRLLTIALLALAVLPARAAESYDNCTGFIETLPVTISTQGVWCLRGNVSTGMTSGNAITVAGNNVTIDCNEFKVGGLAAGPETQAIGIQAAQRQGITIRNCGIRGFRTGIDLAGGFGHLVEDNRLDGNTYMGAHVNGDYSLVQRNRIFDMGGNATLAASYSLVVGGDAVDNVITGASGSAPNFAGVGIVVNRSGALVRGNRISGLENSGTGGGVAIQVANATGVRLEGNHLVNNFSSSGNSSGILAGASDACIANSVLGYATAISGCPLGSANVSAP
jgi:hypothetical protein